MPRRKRTGGQGSAMVRHVRPTVAVTTKLLLTGDSLMTDALQNLLKQLRLSGLLSTLEVRLHEAAANHLDHREFLELILQDELAVRSDRLLQRRVKAAQFREVKA